ncbi:glycerate kinase [Plantibacter sp. ME-Dv--P-122b]|uniref:glycerate kinase n=1 Tax=Plantibacter sp. ME-Dv--P-122b TaxID=3040300 RepID=UPI00254B7267|nr:glycerate kinase [Plantibacter sp. ME-Dv--P-122b]
MHRRTVVISPDSFKGTAEAPDVARSIAEGWCSVRPDDEVVQLPMADGGEGTLDAFAAAVPGAVRHAIVVTGPDGREVASAWLELPDRTGVVELALTSGLTLLDDLRPFEAQTIGFGEAIAAALDAGVERLLLAIGGSSSTDGGMGLLQALGARFRDAEGRDLPPGNTGAGSVVVVDCANLRALPPGGAVILNDVANPLLGPDGAAAVYGPQKGARPDDVAALEAALGRFVGQLAAAETPVEARSAARTPGAGAAGGAGFGLLLWGATPSSGATGVGAAIGLPEAVGAADLVVTGEGRYDAQTASGKVAAYVAAQAPGRTMLVAGAIAAATEDVFRDAVSLTELAGGVEAAMADPLVHLRAAGAALASRVGVPAET